MSDLQVALLVIGVVVIGGVIAYGLVGLFIGAVLLAVGWVLMMEWLRSSRNDRDQPAKASEINPRGALTAAE